MFFFPSQGILNAPCCFFSVASIYLLVISDQFDENVHGDSVVNSTTSLLEAVMGVSFLGNKIISFFCPFFSLHLLLMI